MKTINYQLSTINYQGVRSGSALLIALFLMATLGVVSFGVSRSYISELRTTTNISATMGAYYAAEAGLERSFLEYKITPDTDDPNLREEEILLRGSDTTPRISVKREISYSGLMADNHCTTTKLCTLDQDQSAQLSIPIGVDNATLHWVWASGSTRSERKVRISYINQQNSEYLHEIGQISQTSQNLNLTTLPMIVRFRPLKGDLSSYYLTWNPRGSKIDTGLTTIQSIGTYNQVNRQLKATIDRATGRLNSVFDYTILSNDSLE